MSCLIPQDNADVANIGSATGASNSGVGQDPSTTELGQQIMSASYSNLINHPISAHFRVSDLLNGAAGRHMLPKSGNMGLSANQIVLNMHGLAINVLEPILARFGKFQINSGFRNYKGGSQHNIGCAVDMYFGGWKKSYEVATELIGLDGKQRVLESFDQLLLESKSGGQPWIHVGWKVDRLRGDYWNALLVGDTTKNISGSNKSLVRVA